jgi:ankyrin repeat protein
MIEKSTFFAKGFSPIRLGNIQSDFLEMTMSMSQDERSKRSYAAVIILKDTFEMQDINNIEENLFQVICIMEKGSRFTPETLILNEEMLRKINSQAIEQMMIKNELGEMIMLVPFRNITLEAFDREKHANIMQKLSNRYLKNNSAAPAQQTKSPDFSLSLSVDAKDLWFSAAKTGSLNTLKSLVQVVDIETVDKNKNNALHLAAEEGQASVVNFLLEQGIKPDTLVKRSRSCWFIALQLAVKNNHLDCVQLLINVNNVNLEVPSYTRTAIHYAQTIEMIELLESNGADIKARDTLDLTIFDLHFAKGNELLTSFLKTKGFAPSTNTLFSVASYGKPDIFNQLQRQGFGIDVIRKRNNYTLLHQAVWMFNLEMTQELLRQGLDVDAMAGTDGNRFTPLHFAANLECHDLTADPYRVPADYQAIIKLLLANGANYKLPQIVNKKKAGSAAGLMRLSTEKFEEKYQESIEAGKDLVKDKRCLVM